MRIIIHHWIENEIAHWASEISTIFTLKLKFVRNVQFSLTHSSSNSSHYKTKRDLEKLFHFGQNSNFHMRVLNLSASFRPKNIPNMQFKVFESGKYRGHITTAQQWLKWSKNVDFFGPQASSMDFDARRIDYFLEIEMIDLMNDTRGI